MMIRAATSDPFSLADAAGVLAGLAVVGAVVFFISMCAQDSPSISDFLHRTQSEADASRFHDLLGALDAPQQAPNLIASAERPASHDGGTARVASATLLPSTPIKRDIELSTRGVGASRDELQAMYDRAIGPGALKSQEAVKTAQRKRLAL
jgi:hypothetical protein